ncbi:MAG TPA: metallophosphoesterase [Alphaproteobacteria bacterium]|nr:metallophosphoesterase [Alphaproteobacteria bacterium]
MKILSAGDLHGDSGLAKRLADKALKEDVDLVILCGDLTHADEKTDNIIGPFLKNGRNVVLVPGNHESLATADFLAEFYDVKNLHGYGIKILDKKTKSKSGKNEDKNYVGLFGCSGVNIGIHQIEDKEAYDLLMRGHHYVKDANFKIMVSHVHPAGTKMEKFTQFFEGSKALRRAIDKLQPDIMLCSHVHEAEGLEEKIGKTRVINVGAKGKIFEI